MDTVTFNISLPKTLADQVDRQISSGQYASRSEFFRTLLRVYDALSGRKAKPLEFVEFEKRPLKEVRSELVATGKYNRKFIDGIVAGLKREGLYVD